nr:rep protein [Cressdnaviricota sp.]UOF81224.1 rep protein [Cressdnaviricota sp.]
MNKNPIIDPKLVEPNIPYTLTINPNDDYQFFKENMEDRIKKSVNHMNYILKNYTCLHINLQMDISRTGRIHWHGTITFPCEMSIKRFFFEIIHELLTKHIIEIDTIEDLVKWTEYMNKLKWLNVNVSTKTCCKRMKEILCTSKDNIQRDFNDFLQ